MTETTGTGKTTRAQRLAMPLAREVVRDLAVEHGACIRPVQLRRRNLDTGEIDTVLVPCGNTLASVCPACAERAKTLRAAQCREGWHLEDEPDITPGPATDAQKWWITQRAETRQARDLIAATGGDTTDFDELITELDDQITNAGIRGKAAPAVPAIEQVSDLGGAKGTRTPGLLDANQTLFQLSYSPEMSPAQGYPLPAGWSVSLAEDKACGLLQQPGQPPVGQEFAAGLAGRAVLQRRVGEGHLLDGVPADRALLARPAVHAQAALLLAFQVRGG